MLRILGPIYRYQGEIITDDIVYIDDHCYDEHTHSFPVKQLLDNNPGERLLVFDHLGHDDLLSAYDHVCLPVYLAAETKGFVDRGIETNWSNKTKCFNFMINKPRANRLAVLDFVQQNKLWNHCHSLPWKTSHWPDIPVTDYRFGDEITLDYGVKNGPYTNAETYDGLLKQTVFEPTCVSIITEPCHYERESMVTEKTLMAMLGGTLPVWAGGWRLPDALRDLGFDVFDDVVDHSYSQQPTADERLRLALTQNMRLFHDFDYVHSIVEQSHARFQHNVELIRQNVFLNLVEDQCCRDPRLSEIAQLWGLPV